VNQMLDHFKLRAFVIESPQKKSNRSTASYCCCLRRGAASAPRAGGAELYKQGGPVQVYVNKVGPYFNPHETYHYYQLPVCRPATIVHKSMSLGELLDGDRMAQSMFDIRFGQDAADKVLCSKQLSAADLEQLRTAVEDLYYFEFVVDDIPVRGFVGTWRRRASCRTRTRFYFSGQRIVFVKVVTQEKAPVDLAKLLQPGSQVAFTYSSDVKFEDRAKLIKDTSFFPKTLEIHWLSVINSLILVLLLIGFVTVILFRILKKDFARCGLQRFFALPTFPCPPCRPFPADLFLPNIPCRPSLPTFPAFPADPSLPTFPCRPFPADPFPADPSLRPSLPTFPCRPFPADPPCRPFPADLSLPNIPCRPLALPTLSLPTFPCRPFLPTFPARPSLPTFPATFPCRPFLRPFLPDLPCRPFPADFSLPTFPADFSLPTFPCRLFPADLSLPDLSCRPSFGFPCDFPADLSLPTFPCRSLRPPYYVFDFKQEYIKLNRRKHSCIVQNTVGSASYHQAPVSRMLKLKKWRIQDLILGSAGTTDHLDPPLLTRTTWRTRRRRRLGQRLEDGAQRCVQAAQAQVLLLRHHRVVRAVPGHSSPACSSWRCSGLFNVHHHGNINSAGIVLYAFTSGIAGFVSCRMFRRLGGERWARNVLLTSFLFAFPLFMVWAVVNSVAWAYGTTQALPWSTVLLLAVPVAVPRLPAHHPGRHGRQETRAARPGRSLSHQRTSPGRSRRALLQDLARALPHRRLPQLQRRVAPPHVELYYIYGHSVGSPAALHPVRHPAVVVDIILLCRVTACVRVALTYFQLSARTTTVVALPAAPAPSFVLLYSAFFFYFRSNMSAAAGRGRILRLLHPAVLRVFLTLGTVSFAAPCISCPYIYTNIKMTEGSPAAALRTL
uniref:Transmembrane 9 superfamily member n=1 Tax=Macrostomum lignano TaxID=282301 RepID=A0A1I8JQS6_9PLAT